MDLDVLGKWNHELPYEPHLSELTIDYDSSLFNQNWPDWRKMSIYINNDMIFFVT